MVLLDLRAEEGHLAFVGEVSREIHYESMDAPRPPTAIRRL